MARFSSMKARQCRRVFANVVVGVLAAQLLGSFMGTDILDVDTMTTFAMPSGAGAQLTASQTAEDASFTQRSRPLFFTAQEPRTPRRATVEGVNIGAKVLNAMGAGAVAAVIQAMFSAVMEPIVNRVLVKRMKVADALAEVTPAMMFKYFQTTISTNFLKFPFFEAINAFCGCLALPSSVRGLITGFVFTTATLPITNYRYRKSMQLEVKLGDLYEAYLPTVIRDIVYGIARNFFTVALLTKNPTWTTADPQVLFIVVMLGCFTSAPFNEWRGYLLQTKGQKIPFGEFFKVQNFVRSTSLGATQQGLAIGIGYWICPIVSKFVNGILAAIR